MDVQGERFGRHLRLLRSAEYKRVFAGSARSSDKSFTVLARENDLGHPRLGLAISRRQVPTAVARNRVKRVIRESFRLHRRQLPQLDIVVLARRGAAGKSGAELRRSLARHWSRIGGRCAG